MLSFQDYSFDGIQDLLSSKSRSRESVEGVNTRKQSHFYGFEAEAGGDAYGFYQDVSTGEGFFFSKYQNQEQKQQSYLDCGLLDDHSYNILSPQLQTSLDGIEKLDEIPAVTQDGLQPWKENQYPFSLASLELHGDRQFDGERIVEKSSGAPRAKVIGTELSTEEIMKMAGAKFIQSFSRMVDTASMLNNPFDLFFSGLSEEAAKNVELAELLLASAEKVGNQQFERANRFLNYCEHLSSNGESPVQRVVHYFSEALRERIDRETGRITPKWPEKSHSFDLDRAMMTLNPAILACYQNVPFSQVAHFAGIQAIVEKVNMAKRIHIIDLEIRNGVQWTVLMQALVSQHESPLELLKISAIGSTSKELIEDTGKRLMSFAETMNVPFSFKVVMVSDMLDLKKDLFELGAEEAVAVYAENSLRSLIALPNRLDSIMKVFRNINPRIVVVMEVEANNNSPSFVNRFIEALFFYCAYFDCFDACMGRDSPNRMIAESKYIRQEIRNIVATEGEERKIRHVKLDVWRTFFARFAMVETELSKSSLYQASLLLNKIARWSSCTLDMNEKSLVIGWKGTPMHSLSVWKFDKNRKGLK